jgi:hypothetical protein
VCGVSRFGSGPARGESWRRVGNVGPARCGNVFCEAARIVDRLGRGAAVAKKLVPRFFSYVPSVIISIFFSNGPSVVKNYFTNRWLIANY